MSDEPKKSAYPYGGAALGGLLAERGSAPARPGEPSFAARYATMTPEARAAFWRVRGPSPAPNMPNVSAETAAVIRLGGPESLTGFRAACARLSYALRADVALLVERRRARLAAAGAR